MKIKLLLIAITLTFTMTGGLWAMENSGANHEKMKEIVYGATVDGKIAFYQKRIYLTDSEFKILADIGTDAVQKIRYLKANRQEIINNMMASNVKLEKARLSAYLGKRIHTISDTMEAYSTK